MNGKYLKSKNECLDDCPEDYFYTDNTSMSCNPCLSNCKKCTNSSTCVSCDNNYHHYNDQCLSVCPDEFYLNISNNTCESCINNCKICTDNLDCSQCNYNKFLLNNTSCYETCPDGYMDNTNTYKCDLCQTSECKTCSSTSICTSCKDNKFLLNNECYTVCPDNYLGNEFTKICDLCEISECKICPAISICISCQNNKFEFNNNCVPSCPSGYYENSDTGKCEMCSIKNCKTCSSGSNCSACHNENFYFNDKCIISCPVGYLANIFTGVCDSCAISDCKTCPTLSTCSSCSNNKFIFNNECLLICPDGYYNDTTDFTCKKCNMTCKTCKGPNINDCLSCSSLNNLPYFRQGTCLASCLIEEIFNPVNKFCIDVKNCIQTFFITSPDVIVLESSDPFITSTLNSSFTLKSTCNVYKDLFTLDSKNEFNKLSLKWENLNGGQLSNNSQTLTLYNSNFVKGIINFKLNLFVNQNTLIMTTEKKIEFKSNKLIPIIKNENNLNFLIGSQISIDASYSYDEGLNEAVSGLPNLKIDQGINYSWMCPSKINSKSCLINKENILKINPNDYSNVTMLKTNFTDYIDLTITKDKRKETKSIKFNLIYLPTVITPNLTLIQILPKLINSNKTNENKFEVVSQSLDIIANLILVNQTNDSNFSTNSSIVIKNDPIKTEIIVKNSEVIINQLLTMTNIISQINNTDKNSTNNKDKLNNQIENILETIIDTPAAYVDDKDKIAKLFNILDNSINSIDKGYNNFKSKENSNDSNTNNINTNKTDSNSNKLDDYIIKKNIENIANLEKKIDKIENNLLNSLQPGQELNINTKNIFIKVAKISSDSKEFSFEEEEISNQIPILDNNNTNPQNNSSTSTINDIPNPSKIKNALIDGCHSKFCLEKDQLQKLTINENVGIKIKYNKINNLPISDITFSDDSLRFNFVLDKTNSNSSTRITSAENTTTNNSKSESKLNEDIFFKVKLKVSKLKDSNDSLIDQTSCLQYNENYEPDPEACSTWYDYEKSEVTCLCKKQGLTVNIFNRTLSSFAKINQFPATKLDIFNPYSLSIVCSLFVLVFILLFSACLVDMTDNRILKNKISRKFDIKQYYIIQYYKEGFHKKFNLWNLFIHNIKIAHPIVSIFYIYTPLYNRKLRLLDILLKLHISFFFTLLPFYSNNFTNTNYEIAKSKRNIEIYGKGVDDFSVTLYEKLSALLFTLASSVISFIITILINFILFYDILNEEAEIRYNSMEKLEKKYLMNEELSHIKKLKNARKKIYQIKCLMKIKLSNNNNTNLIFDHSATNLDISNTDSVRIPLRLDKDDQIKLLNKNDIFNNNIYERVGQMKYENKNLTKVNSIEISIGKKKNSSNFQIQKRNKIIYYKNNSISIFKKGKRNFTYYLSYIYVNQKLHNKIDCHYVQILQIRNEETSLSTNLSLINKNKIFSTIFSNEVSLNIRIRSIIKFLFIISIFVFCWFYFAIFVLYIFQKYGNNIFTICFWPLISMITLQNLIIANLLIFVDTLIVTYTKNKYSKIKEYSIGKIIYDLIVSQSIQNHYEAIIKFRKLVGKFETE